MANRPAWGVISSRVEKRNFQFEYFNGLSVEQKQKSIRSLHNSIGLKSLEVSTKSENKLGKKLSAFNLKLNGKVFESLFQSCKVRELGGPFTYLKDIEPKETKKFWRDHKLGKLTHFEFNGFNFPKEPASCFYDYIYILAVKETLEYEEILDILNYDFFTDIEFNPEKSINCQARSVAIIKLLILMYGEIPDLNDIEQWIKFHKAFVYG